MRKFLYLIDIIALLLCILNAINGYEDENVSALLGWTSASMYVFRFLIKRSN